MILQALAEYYARQTREDGSSLAPPAFERKEIPFIVVLDREGNFVDLEDTRTGEGKKKRGRLFAVPLRLRVPGGPGEVGSIAAAVAGRVQIGGGQPALLLLGE